MRVRVRLRRLVAVSAAVIGGLAVALALVGSAGASNTGNQLRARQEAVRLLGLLRPPPGAVALTREPRDDHGALAQPGYDEVTPNLVDDHRWWMVGGRATRVLAYVSAHLPRGARPYASWWGGPRYAAAESFALPPLPGVLDQRVLSVTVVQLTATETGVRTDGEAVWVSLRPASERLPASVREIVITRVSPSEPSRLVARVRDPAKVGRIVVWLNALGIAQPGSMICPSFGFTLIRFAFRSGTGERIAAASVYAGGPSGQCNPIELSLRGRRQPPLVGAGFLARVERLLGVSLTAADAAVPRASARARALDVLGPDGIGAARFGASPRRVRSVIDALLKRPGGAYLPGGSCGLDHQITWRLGPAAGREPLTVYFRRSAFAGYQLGALRAPPAPGGARAPATLRGLRLGDTMVRGRRLYGAAFRLSTAQGGSWSVRTSHGLLDGYAWGRAPVGDISWASRVATIDAGDVGCAAIAP